MTSTLLPFLKRPLPKKKRKRNQRKHLPSKKKRKKSQSKSNSLQTMTQSITVLLKSKEQRPFKDCQKHWAIHSILRSGAVPNLKKKKNSAISP